jgi:hypothetical protein
VNQVTTKVVGQNQSKLVPALGNYSVMFKNPVIFTSALYFWGTCLSQRTRPLAFAALLDSKCPDLFVRREEEAVQWNEDMKSG